MWSLCSMHTLRRSHPQARRGDAGDWRPTWSQLTWPEDEETPLLALGKPGCPGGPNGAGRAPGGGSCLPAVVVCGLESQGKTKGWEGPVLERHCMGKGSSISKDQEAGPQRREGEARSLRLCWPGTQCAGRGAFPCARLMLQRIKTSSSPLFLPTRPQRSHAASSRSLPWLL